MSHQIAKRFGTTSFHNKLLFEKPWQTPLEIANPTSQQGIEDLE